MISDKIEPFLELQNSLMMLNSIKIKRFCVLSVYTFGLKMLPKKSFKKELKKALIDVLKSENKYIEIDAITLILVTTIYTFHFSSFNFLFALFML